MKPMQITFLSHKSNFPDLPGPIIVDSHDVVGCLGKTSGFIGAALERERLFHFRQERTNWTQEAAFLDTSTAGKGMLDVLSSMPFV